jgi:hypothetical protein
LEQQAIIILWLTPVFYHFHIHVRKYQQSGGLLF